MKHLFLTALSAAVLFVSGRAISAEKARVKLSSKPS